MERRLREREADEGKKEEKDVLAVVTVVSTARSPASAPRPVPGLF